MLFFAGLLIFVILVFGVAKFSADAPIYLFSFLAVLGSVLFPVWFFQGMEKMSYVTIVTIAVKLIWIIAIFLFIKVPGDILLLVIFNGSTHVLIGLISFILIKAKFGVKFLMPSIGELKSHLIEGWYIFISTASITLYTTSNTFILGLFAGNETVGYFAAADKIRIAIQGLFGNASQAVFPYLSKLFAESKKKAVNFVKKYLRLTVSVSIVITILMFLFADKIVLLVLGENYIPSINVFKIILFLPLIILLSNIYGIQIMLNLGYKKEFSRIILFAGIVNLILSFILVPAYFEIGTAISVIITELIVTFGMMNFVRKKKILETG